MTGQRKSLTQRLLEGGVTTGLLLFALVPVYWMVSSSLKSDPELSQIGRASCRERVCHNV